MDSWHATFLGLRHLPREVTGFEIEVFFQFSAEEARIIEERRRPELKLGLALQIGFLRMSGRLLDAVRMVPPLLWRHLGERFSVAAPDLASLRAMYRRAPTLIEHQQLACEVLGFQWLTGITAVPSCECCARSFPARTIASGCSGLRAAGSMSTNS